MSDLGAWEILGNVPIEQLRSIRVKSALASLIASLPIVPFFLFAAHVFRDDPILRYGFSLVAVAPVGALLWAFVYFAVRRPEMLRSEEGALRDRALTLIGQQTGQVLDSKALEVVMNPLPARRLPEENP